MWGKGFQQSCSIRGWISFVGKGGLGANGLTRRRENRTTSRKYGRFLRFIKAEVK